MHTVLKNQTFELMLSLGNRLQAIHFLQQFRAVFQPHFVDTCATVYD